MDHDEFASLALDALMRIKDDLLPNLTAGLHDYFGRWHPSGFLIYQLGIIPDLGMLRLHAWPAFVRKSLDKGDTIHDHAWHIASVVLKGCYSDTIFQIDHEPDDTERPNLLTLFDTNYIKTGSQILQPKEGNVVATPIQKRSIPEGSVHTIKPGVFHQPTIDRASSTVTLVLASFRALEQGPHVVFEQNTSSLQESREVPTFDDTESVKSLLS
jgi:hypothetical protein